jgi:exonuclease VII small subunit
MEEDIKELRQAVADLRTSQTTLEKELISLQADIHYIKHSQDSLNANLSRILWIIGGGFIASIVGYIVNGGISGG